MARYIRSRLLPPLIGCLLIAVCWGLPRAGAQTKRKPEPTAQLKAVPAPITPGFQGTPDLPGGSTTVSPPATRPQTSQPPGGPAPPGMRPAGPGPLGVPPPPPSPAHAFQFKFDPKAPLTDLLPAAPKSPMGRLLPDDLAHVPEVSFQPPIAKGPKALEQTAFTVAKIKHVNKSKTDAYMAALMKHRADLSGLPFTLGAACRLKNERSALFTAALTNLRALLGQQVAVSITDASAKAAEIFWANLQQNWANQDQAPASRQQRDHIIRGRIAALMQVLGPESPALRRGLVRYLATVSHVESTRALARLAIFSAEDQIRQDAIDALKVRREKDYTDILRNGLRYPWPAVAGRASEALVKLERNDLVTELVAMLDEPDPRAAIVKQVDGKEVPIVRELVRINHHRNCVMCHAPTSVGEGGVVMTPESIPPGAFGGKGEMPFKGSGSVMFVRSDPTAAEIPVPGQPLPTPSQGYGNSQQDILVRIDVTYLRQDFSLRQRVPDAQPWPEMQRFDFLVRTRVVSEEEAKANRDELGKRAGIGQSPYQTAVLVALRELTGRDAAPTAAAWRRVLQ